MNAPSAVAYFLLTTLFSLATFVLWVRLFIRYFALGKFHSVSQTVYRLTDAIVGPVQKHITRSLGSRGRFDVPCLMLLFLCEWVKYLTVNLLFLDNALSMFTPIVYAVLDMLIQPCQWLFYAVIGRTVMSWVKPGWRHPFAQVLLVVTEPLLRTIRRALPNTGMLDFAPLVAMILLKAITIFLSSLLI
jgi:YggT family protein